MPAPGRFQKSLIMRHFFKNKLEKVGDNPSRREIAEILDTDEDRVINQYKRYLSYINHVKEELIRRSAELVGYNKKVSLGHS
jgi:hypothetical protein